MSDSESHELVTVGRFQRHEDLDDSRHRDNEKQHRENQERLSKIEIMVGYVRGWLAAIAAIMVLILPVLNHFVSVWLSPANPVKNVP